MAPAASKSSEAATTGGAGLRPPRWLVPLALLLVVAGIADATDLTVAHYTTPVILACPDTGIINCAKVTSSTYSEILGVPLPVLGLLFFVAMLPLQLPVAWRSRSSWLRRLRLVLAGSGVLMVFWLLYVELFRLNAICLYCTGVHVLTVALFAVTAIGTASTETVSDSSS
jgi:uncharacterized membrane protein